ncbi:hypothetical protein QC762_401335 [Podospora pseudocomata]|uniref:Uncharacterized protein n=1 Tax=Podospora pseudocomata TaxID=2093779 RepID=A0ABR0GEK5_9PEZI|nr:hypothetical protein QC762_401335 [Podospora pseudocomata]
MFQLKTFITLLALGGFSAMAARPQQMCLSQSTAESLAERMPPSMPVRTSTHHEINFPSNWDNKISAIKNNNKNALKCRWYLNRDCQGSSYDAQEDQKLNDGNGNFNDSISSWKCCHKGGCFGNRVAGNSTEIENSNAEIKAHV